MWYVWVGGAISTERNKFLLGTGYKYNSLLVGGIVSIRISDLNMKPSTCIRCGREIPSNLLRCPNCGMPRRILTPVPAKCPICGHEFAAVPAKGDRQLCPNCGRKVKLWTDRPFVECPHCGHRWIPRINDPKKCPACGKNIQGEGRKSVKCPHCGHEWRPRRPNPVKCPACGKSLVVASRPEMTCPHCGYRWRPKKDSPARCPRCLKLLAVADSSKKKKLRCPYCGYVWIARVERPKRCPNCFTRLTRVEELHDEQEPYLKIDREMIDRIVDSLIDKLREIKYI